MFNQWKVWECELVSKGGHGQRTWNYMITASVGPVEIHFQIIWAIDNLTVIFILKDIKTFLCV